MTNRENSSTNSAQGTPQNATIWRQYPEVIVNTATHLSSGIDPFQSIAARRGEWIEASSLPRARQLRTVARSLGPLTGGLNAAGDLYDLLRSLRLDLSQQDKTLSRTCAKIIGATLSSIFAGGSVVGAAGLLASGITFGSAAGAGALLAAGGAAAYYSAKYAVNMVDGLQAWITRIVK